MDNDNKKMYKGVFYDSYKQKFVAKIQRNNQVIKKCPHYTLQTYDNGINQYYGCSKNGLLIGLSFYPNCLMQCKKEVYL